MIILIFSVFQKSIMREYFGAPVILTFQRCVLGWLRQRLCQWIHNLRQRLRQQLRQPARIRQPATPAGPTPSSSTILFAKTLKVKSIKRHRFASTITSDAVLRFSIWNYQKIKEIKTNPKSYHTTFWRRRSRNHFDSKGPMMSLKCGLKRKRQKSKNTFDQRKIFFHFSTLSPIHQ